MPRVLDLYCCAGGASAGYARAGYDVDGVDIEYRPDYPFPLHLGDAIGRLRHLTATGDIMAYDLIHASPPCQADCALTVGTNDATGWGGQHVSLIDATRDALNDARVPYVIEQPPGRSGIRRDITLCGEMFGLPVIRHRHFEMGGWTMAKPAHIPHRGRVRGWRHGTYYDGPYLAAYGEGGGKASIAEMQAALEMPWALEREELTEAIPPAYTEAIGKAFLTSRA